MARRKLSLSPWLPEAQRQGSGRNPTAETNSSPQSCLRESEQLRAELEGQLESMAAEAQRANERWRQAVMENKALKSRWGSSMISVGLVVLSIQDHAAEICVNIKRH
jgi:hypothetical protein